MYVDSFFYFVTYCNCRFHLGNIYTCHEYNNITDHVLKAQPCNMFEV